MVYCSLKENTYYDSELNVFDYKLVDDKNNVIYFGHSVKNPKTGINRINITEIVRDYLYSNLEDDWPELSNESGYTYQQENAFRRFALINGEITLETYGFLLNFDNNPLNDELVLSNPINGRADPRQKVFWSLFTKTTWVNEYEKDFLTIRALEDGVAVKLVHRADSHAGDEYHLAHFRLNGGEWTSSNPVILNAGDELECYGKMRTYPEINIGFDIKGRCEVYGNEASILYETDFMGKYESEGEFLFSGCDIVAASKLYIPPKTSMYGYRYMFAGCKYLIYPPVFYETKVEEEAYDHMFAGCISLVNAPELPAMELSIASYVSMFEGCTSLVNGPSILPATSLTLQCYYRMFKDCTSLVNAPVLPALLLNSECYKDMFMGCTSLVTAPVLPCEYPTFDEYPINGYDYMFSGCTNLSYVKCLVNDGTQQTGVGEQWLIGVSPTGTFVKKTGAVWLRGVNGIPEGWTVEEADA